MSKTFEAKVKTKPLPLNTAGKKALADTDAFDWILFTSQNAVRYFIQKLRDEKSHIPKDMKIAAVGPATALALKKHKIRITKIPKKSTSEDLLLELQYLRGKCVLFPRSDIAPHGLISRMRKRGAKVTVIPLYTTVPVLLSSPEKAGLLSGKYADIYFKSPSGIRGLLEQFTATQKKQILSIPVNAIGPMTSKKAREAGFRRVRDLSL